MDNHNTVATTPTIYLAGSGLFIPPHTVTNEELVQSYNEYVEQFNARHQAQIANHEITALEKSSTDFIEKASGIKARYAMYKEGITDKNRMRPVVPERTEETPLEIVDMAIAAAKQAMQQAAVSADEIDAVILTTTNHQRAYPSAAVEVQQKLGINGFAFDMGIACSSATFGLASAYAYVKSGMVNTVLVVNPEFATPQVDFTSRDSHFIFGDVATAAIISNQVKPQASSAFKILASKQFTQYSTNIRCDGSYLDHCIDNLPKERPYFKQQGKKVFKELLPLATDFISTFIQDSNLNISELKRFWLHQANINMNSFAIKKLLGREPHPNEAPICLDEFANTASSGSMIVFHQHKDDFTSSEKGIICSFGAGYSIGGLLVEKL